MLRDEIKCLKSSVKYLNDVRVQNDCIVNGIILEDENVKPTDIVLNIAKKTGASISEADINETYFLGRGKTSTQKKSVVVKFNNRKTKEDFMQKKKNMKAVTDLKNVYVNDFLSKDTLELFKHAKSLKSVGYKIVYIRSGKIFAKKDENSRQLKINNMDDVDRLLLKYSGNASERDRATGNDYGDSEYDEEDIAL